VIFGIRSDRISRAKARVAQSVKCGEQRGGAGERSNERSRGIESCTVRRCYVAEERTCDDGGADAQAEVQHDTLPGTLGEPVHNEPAMST